MKTLAELVELVGGMLYGDGTITVAGVADLESARSGEITFLSHEKKRDLLAASKATAAVVPLSTTAYPLPVIQVKDPYLAIARIHTLFLSRPFEATGIDPKAVIGNDCRLSRVVSVGPMVVIGARVVLGERVTIGPGVVIGDDVVIGNDTTLKPNVTVGDGTLIGCRVMIHAGTVIGSDGFGYATDHLGRHVKRPQVGIVQIDDDVEIGSNVSIDRATFGRTWVKRGAKIDNLVQVAHNVVVGEDSILVSQVGISGSSILGTGVVLGGQAGVAGHVRIGDRVMAAARAGIHADIPEKSVVSGFPAIAHPLWLRISSLMTKLPDLVRDVRALKKQVADLMEK
ncbi:MAG: UDP-3-O-(3-hydroxymyristoyl)glucosamine N-acyltransferase [Proteobacteria bacterium]|nr:UDP-3-O-(3-hydroxymyristoyl)glucosamine N-acyltransferase [Desulfobulbaceae bacterium]MBU4151689.1 UDP-3-O-(3-hydroxymyristoyl)glucosamine N-acyltransferase [Pseudomonadota bacterium]